MRDYADLAERFTALREPGVSVVAQVVPRPGQAVTVGASAGVQYPAGRVWLLPPADAIPVGGSSSARGTVGAFLPEEDVGRYVAGLYDVSGQLHTLRLQHPDCGVTFESVMLLWELVERLMDTMRDDPDAP